MRSLFALITVLALSLTMACVSTPRHQATVASGSVYGALAALQDAEAILHVGGQVTDAQHKVFAAKMVTALEAGRAFNTAVAAWPKNTPVPVDLRQVIDNVFVSAHAAVASLPLGAAREALVLRILAVAQSISDTLLNRL